MAWRPTKQHTLLQSQDEPTPGFANNFRSSHLLSQALAQEKSSGGNLQLAYLQKKARQAAYVQEARKRPLPPLESVVSRQELISDIRRNAVENVLSESFEKPAQRERRLGSQASFLASREARHRACLEDYDGQTSIASEQCKLQIQEASQAMKNRVDSAITLADELLDPLEKNSDLLGALPEENVRGVMTSLEGVIVQRTQDIAEFEAELQCIDGKRCDANSVLLRGLAESLSATAHCVPSEIERIIEEKTLALDATLLENQKAAKVLGSKLRVQAQGASKKYKSRWQDGLLLWRQKRHQHTIEKCLQRIRSAEFEQPSGLVECLQRVKQEQTHAFEARMGICRASFNTPLDGLAVGLVRSWEEMNAGLNDKSGDSFDLLFAELKKFADDLDNIGRIMLQDLAEELKIHDAKTEWGEHETVEALIDADVLPLLQERIAFHRVFLTQVSADVSKQEEAQHVTMTQLIAFFLSLARRGEALRKHIVEFDINYKGEADDCVADFAEQCTKNEDQMNRFKESIENAAHHEDLDKLKQDAFEHLDGMEQQYRDHSQEHLAIHLRYPASVEAFFRKEAAGFCLDLGLLVEPEPLVEDPEADPQVVAATAEAHASALADADNLAEWGTVGPYKVLEKLNLHELRKRLLTPATSEDPPSETEAVAEAMQEGNISANRAAEAEPQTETRSANLWDGSSVLAVLDFEEAFLEEGIDSVRSFVFAQLREDYGHLNRIDTDAVCEQVRKELDQRLRRHTNRKGEVQVEWYVPRHAVVAKHKDKFERHLIELAKKNIYHDETFEELFRQMDAEEATYQEKIKSLQSRLAEAESLPMLTAFERQALEMSNSFWEASQSTKGKLFNLSSEHPRVLMKSNRDFLKMCTRAEGYSQTELEFYTGQVDDVNNQIEEKIKQREERTRLLEDQLEEKRQGPLTTFTEAYNEAVENLCASKGYGKKYGKPRRKVQGLCRTLISHSVTVKQNLQEVLKYMEALCNQPPDEIIDFTSLPTCPKFSIRDQIPDSGESWTFGSELLGTFYILVGTLNVLGIHLRAFKDDRTQNYQVAHLPNIRVLRESEVLCDQVPADDDEVAKASLDAEKNLRQNCLDAMLGEIFKCDTFEATVKNLVADAQKDSQEVFKGTVPEFMTKFLEEMQETANSARLEAARGLRERSDYLREKALTRIGDALFGELTARAISELRRGAKETQSSTVALWTELDSKRTVHEMRLNPGLSNPNAETELLNLIQAESERSEKADTAAAEDCARMASCLRTLADEFARRVTADFEKAVRLVDRIPLHTHFGALPGDEQNEIPRISIKRRMRHLQNGTSVDQWGDGLPERQWIGIPRFELRKLLLREPWPEDEEGTQATEEKLAENSPTVDSFRSPLHKHLFDRRGHYWELYRAEFRAEEKRRRVELSMRLESELAARRSWECMICQLRGEIPTS